MLRYSLEGSEFIPLCDLLKATGLCDTGGQAKHLISEGAILVDSQVETRKRCKIRPGQKVQFEDQLIEVTE